MSNQKQNRATLRDVAELAGVSMQTVSRVANKKSGVAQKTLKKVTKAMEQLGYRPNNAARMLLTQRSYALEVVVLDAPLPYPLVQMAKTASQNNYYMIFTSSTEAELPEVLESMMSRLIDGFILIAPRMEDAEAKLEEFEIDIPFVYMGALVGSKFPSVIFDQTRGMELLIEHLVTLGHRRIAEISGPLDHEGGITRHKVWLKLTEQYGLDTSLSVSVDFSMRGGYQGVHKLLDQNSDFSAVIAGNDHIAMGALRGLHERGLRVPDDYSIVGFDDEVHAAFTSPTLTTVRQDFTQLGNLATNYLISLIEDETTPIHQRVLVPELIIRESTKKI